MLIFIAAAQLPFFYIACYFWRAAQANRLTLRRQSSTALSNVELVLARASVHGGRWRLCDAEGSSSDPDPVPDRTSRATRPSRRATPTEMCEIQIGIESEDFKELRLYFPFGPVTVDGPVACGAPVHVAAARNEQVARSATSEVPRRLDMWRGGVRVGRRCVHFIQARERERLVLVKHDTEFRVYSSLPTANRLSWPYKSLVRELQVTHTVVPRVDPHARLRSSMVGAPVRLPPRTRVTTLQTGRTIQSAEPSGATSSPLVQGW